ncbi:MAG: xanthine dehydrogenase family protein molybdopterin-binding subunit [Acidimicrobiales bacterium]|nr:xanthine dehydrogenase family protein molybdopterin-binding subunit [Acidimicrobiales bacterium]
MGFLGTAVRRREDHNLLTGRGRYVANLHPPGTLHAVYVRSLDAHAELVDVDVSAAAAHDGVHAVFMAGDLDGPLAHNTYPPPFPGMNEQMVRPLLATGRVRYVGEPVAVVVAATPSIAADAAELVVVDTSPLQAVVDPEQASEGLDLLFPGIDDWAAARHETGPAVSFDDCDVVVRGRFVNQRMSAAPIEARAAMAWWEGERLVHWTATQGSHNNQAQLCQVYDLPADRVRVITPDVGGSFGAKFRAYPEETMLAWLSSRVGAPVAWTETRSESMVNLGHGRGQIQHVTIGGRSDGTITHYHLDVIQDAGAYPLIAAFLPRQTMTMLTGSYDIEHASFHSVSVPTNTAPNGAYRGAGRPEATAAIERAVDLFASEVGLDPALVRRRNLVPAEAFPYTNAVGTTYDTGDYASALDTALATVGYDDLRADQARRRAAGEHVELGIGVASYVEITASTAAGDYGAVALDPDGTIRAVTSTTPHGQGHHTVWSTIVGDALGVAPERVTVVSSDTDLVPRGVVTGGSRSAQVGGALLHDAANHLVDRARPLAADALEAADADVVFDTDRGVFHVAGTPSRSVGWDGVAERLDAALLVESDWLPVDRTYPFGAHVAVVEVDTETGAVEVLRIVAVDDAGTVLNPLIFDGQVHGGIGGGIAQALFEEIVFDADGTPRTSNFADYAIPSAAELPSFELVRHETPTFCNPLGAKGVGEAGTIGATAAVQSAVCDALAPYGVRHIDMPCTPQRVWNAVVGSVAPPQ